MCVCVCVCVCVGGVDGEICSDRSLTIITIPLEVCLFRIDASVLLNVSVV